MDAFSSKSLALQAQKKLVSRLASKAVAGALLDDASSEVLDELYRATKEFTRSRREAQKVVKNLVKVMLKLAVLLRGGQLGSEELATLRGLRRRARSLAMTLSHHLAMFQPMPQQREALGFVGSRVETHFWSHGCPTRLHTRKRP
ncbi:tumor necrosis factor alpha-induced protein 8-like protein 1 [Echinops telfairi]|uniref:Tumor necrosis factor alpha-induced protein 8-like protein 1 n=1 Tax=Echinops telfairi TaxID=9371 RepID=A0ABM0J457_ECHTE|nr:tumor necrosis factor alpha-induced protein 8-like protein 1 [Echinops telfairi]